MSKISATSLIRIRKFCLFDQDDTDSTSNTTQIISNDALYLLTWLCSQILVLGPYVFLARILIPGQLTISELIYEGNDRWYS